jgi:hypothetical protein
MLLKPQHLAGPDAPKSAEPVVPPAPDQRIQDVATDKATAPQQAGQQADPGPRRCTGCTCGRCDRQSE